MGGVVGDEVVIGAAVDAASHGYEPTVVVITLGESETTK